MKNYFNYLILTVFLGYQVNAQDTAYARMIINTLSSEEFSGRGYVDNGLEKSASFITSEFSKIGLKPFNDSFKQTFSYGVNTFPGAMELQINSERLQPGIDFLVDPTSPSCSGRFNTITVLSVDLLNHKKLNKVIKGIKGKFLIIDDRIQAKLSKEEAKTLADLINYFKYNSNLKSAGTIVLTDEKLSWGPSPIVLSRPVFTVRSELLLDEIKSVEVDVESIYKPEFESSNLIGYIQGETVPDSFLVITAHYDHLGKMGSDTYFPGANDNSSGVALMLNLAKYFSSKPCKYTIVFIALTGEEIGLLGAKYFAENPVFDLPKIKFLINFDLAGTGIDGIKVVNGSVFQKKFDMLTKINQENNYLSSIQKRGEACNSDHCMFYNQGVPCFYIYTLGGSKAYHDIYDKSSNLPLIEFQAYMDLMIQFLIAQ